MIALDIGLVTFDRQTLRYWEALLSGGSLVDCHVAVRCCYSDQRFEVPPVQIATKPGRNPIWLIDMPLPHPLLVSLNTWLTLLSEPVVGICSSPQVVNQLLSVCSNVCLVSHPEALTSLPPLPSLLALVATSSVTDGPIYIGIEPPPPRLLSRLGAARQHRRK